jgi:hypothetical protein
VLVVVDGAADADRLDILVELLAVQVTLSLSDLQLVLRVIKTVLHKLATFS